MSAGPEKTTQNGALAALLLVLACGQPQEMRVGIRPERTATARTLTQPSPAEPLLVGNGVTAPVVISRVEPDFPPITRNQRVGGAILLEAIISANGQVEAVRILSNPETLGAHEAAEAVRKWRFKPATLRGTPVRVRFTISVNIHWS